MTTTKTPKPFSPQVQSVLDSRAELSHKIEMLREELPSLSKNKKKVRSKLLELQGALKILNRKAVRGEDLKAIFLLTEEVNLRLQYPEIEIN